MPITMLPKFNDLQADLSAVCFEREEIIRGVLAAILARRHVLQIGPPGTGKSMVLNELLLRIMGAKGYVRLLTKFSQPEELCGPYSINGLKQDRYERITQGTMIEADFVFLDEIFKSNSAILNSLLTFMNERAFDNGTNRIKCPLNTLMGASNELIEDDTLGALLDRFMLRFYTDYLASDDAFADLMLMDPWQNKLVSLTLADLHAAQAEVQTVKITRDFINNDLAPFKRHLKSKGFGASDRRWKESMDLLRAYAWLDGRSAVTRDDLLVYCNVLWDKAEDRKLLQAEIIKWVNPGLAEITKHYDAFRVQLDRYLGEMAKGTSRDTGVMIEARGKMETELDTMRQFQASNPVTAAGDDLVSKASDDLASKVKNTLNLK